jgi:hypothetical protein
MTEDEKIKEWKYDFAWRQLENAQLDNERLDNKAMNIINFSSLIAPLMIGVIFYVTDNSMATACEYVLMIGSLFLMFGSIAVAFKATWLKDQGIIRTKEHFDKIGNDDIKKILGNTAVDIADWQEKVVDAGLEKGGDIYISNVLFIVALVFMSLGVGHVLFF